MRQQFQMAVSMPLLARGSSLSIDCLRLLDLVVLAERVSTYTRTRKLGLQAYPQLLYQ